MPERFKGVDSSSTIERFVGSNPTPYNSIFFYTIVYYYILLYINILIFLYININHGQMCAGCNLY